MRETSYEKILTGVAARMGLDSTATLQASTRASLTEYLNSRIDIGWGWDRWPELCTFELRDVVTAEGARSIPLETSALEPIGEIFGVYIDNPDTTLSPRETQWALRSDRIILDPSRSETQLYIYYRTRPSQYSSVSWSAASTYAAGDIVRFTDGHCYLALAASTGQQPDISSSWEKVPVPAILSEYLKSSIYSDTLREDGQIDKAQAEEYRAEGYLINESDKIGLQVGNNGGSWTARVA
jgi:hypothetical protein